MILRDINCTKDTLVVLGKQEKSIYGKGIPIEPRREGRKETEHFQKIYLPELLPLEEYDFVIILLSGGKDSVACFYKLLELGVPKERIELWHHDIDGGHPTRRMDWRCTQAYVKALAEAEGVKLRVSYRVDGFFGELYRIGASQPIAWMDPDTKEVLQGKISPAYLRCLELKKQDTEEAEALLKAYGYRRKFPAKSADLSKRWCSTYLKISVADSVISNLERLGAWKPQTGRQTGKKEKKILIVSGERRGESASRSKYNEMEIHRTNAEKRFHRTVHQWRAVIDYSEKDVWEVLKRHQVTPHPCYRVGWNRCSCAMCIFSTPSLFAGIKELYPREYEAIKQDERILGFTLDNKKCLDDFVGKAKSCVVREDAAALRSIQTGEFSVREMYTKNWDYPVGAFHGAAGGSC